VKLVAPGVGLRMVDRPKASPSNQLAGERFD
jgi:hypothetical protein